jgi:hypothetical protein
MNLNEQTRAYVYRIALAILGALSLYGLIGPEDIPVWTGVIVSVLGIGTSGLASANTTRKPTEDL